MEKLDLQKELSFEEVEHFFSDCGEYTVTRNDSNGTLKIEFGKTDTVEYDSNLKPSYTYKYTSILTYKPTYQTLIRNIHILGWNEANEIYD